MASFLAVAGLVAFSTNGWAGPVLPAPIASWSFDNDTTESVSGTAGTLFGDAAISPESFIGAGALALDGDGDSLETNLDVALDSPQVSISLWFRAAGSDIGTLIAKTGVDGFGEEGAKAIFHDGETLFFDEYGLGAALGEGEPFLDGLWHHLVLVRDDVNYAFFLDGAPMNSFIEGGIGDEIIADGKGHTLKFGYFEFEPGEEFPWYFEGTIDDARIYDVALTEEQVAALIAEVVDCSDGPDTHCIPKGTTIDGPEGNLPGIYTVTVDASDDSGDDNLIYSLTAERDDGVAKEETQIGNNVFEIFLPGGTWNITVSVDDKSLCPDEAKDSSCTLDPINVVRVTPELVGLWCFEDDRELTTVSDSISGLNGEISVFDEKAKNGTAPVETPTFNRAPGTVGVSALSGAGDTFALIPTSLEDPNPINLNADYTVTAWIRTNEEDAGTIFSQLPNFEDEIAGAQVWYVCEGLLWVDVFEVGAVESSGFVSDGEWHFVAVAVERDLFGDNERVQFFIDGLPVDSFPEEGIDFQEFGDTPLPLDTKIGGGAPFFPECGPSNFVGQIDNVQFWSGALTEDEILDARDISAAGEDCPVAKPPDCSNPPEVPCPTVILEGPKGDLEGTWTIIAELPKGLDPADFSFTFAGERDDFEDDFELTKIGEAEAEVRLSAGGWNVSVEVDIDPFCDNPTPAGCDASAVADVQPLPEELIAAFCFEDSEDESTADSVNGIGAELLAVPKGIGDGFPPQRDDGLVSDTALVFDGVDDGVAVELDSRITASNSFSMACWLQVGPNPDFEKGGKEDPFDLYAGNIAMLGPEIGESGDAPGFISWFVYDGKPMVHVLFCCGDPGQFGEEGGFKAGFVADGEPHHVAVSVQVDFEGDLDLATVYVDGVLAGELEGNFQEEGAPDEWPLTIGHSAFDWPSADFPAESSRDINHFNGTIDDFKFWSFALSEEEVLEEFENPPGEGCGVAGDSLIRGDPNNDGGIDISDAIFTLNHLFGSGPAWVCPEAADINDDGGNDISDAIFLLNGLFGGGPQPPAPNPDCGPDPNGASCPAHLCNV